MSEDLRVDLCVVNYNTKDKLIRLLDHLHSDYEWNVWNLYIADNESTDGSVEWLKQNYKDYKISYVLYNKNIGYARAINHLATLGRSKYLAAVNADTWFTTNHVNQMINSFESNPNQAICGPKQVDESNVIRHGGIFWDGETNPVHRGWQQHDPQDSLYKDRKQCWTVSGSMYYVRRSVWNELTNYVDYRALYPNAEGAFLPSKHYFEETFCSQLAQHLGYEVWYDGTVETIGHTWHASNKVGSNNAAFAESRMQYIDACNYIGIKHECR